MSVDGYSGLPIEGGISEAQRLGYEDQPVPIEFTREVPPPDPMVMQQAAEAAQTGRKDVFDVSMLVGLLKTNRSDDLIGDYTKTFRLCLDRVGRVLFKLFWDREMFVGRFGEDDIDKLETTLLDVLDTLGDLTLFVTRKNNKPEISDILDSIGMES
jgi:hypothetical protein